MKLKLTLGDISFHNFMNQANSSYYNKFGIFWSVFRLNAVKYEPQKFRIQTLFT